MGGCRNVQGMPIPVRPTARTMFGPRGCLLSPNGPFWVADTGHHRLLGWRQWPKEDRQPADWVIGQPDFESEGRNAKSEPGPLSLNVPTGLAAYGEGLAVADAWNHRVLIWKRAPEGSHHPPDLVLGQQDFVRTDMNQGRPTPSADTLYWPYGVSACGTALTVADTGNRRVLIWLTPPGRNGQPADVVLGQPRFDRRDENAGGPAGRMSMRWPHAIARWGDALCVADAGNNRIMVWKTMPEEQGADCDWILGQPDASQSYHNLGQDQPSARSLNMPYGLAVSGGWLIVADTANSRLLGWHKQNLATGAAAWVLGGQPTFEAKGENQWKAASRETLCWPYGLSIAGRLLAVADSGNNRILLRTLHPEVTA
jgi:hypothetical protein